MSLPTFTKSWNLTKLNQRISYVSLNDTVATLLYGIKDYLVATMGATVVWSSNGTTGPTNSGDTTDRWTSKTAVTVRGATTTAANSWIIIQWAGVQFLMSYVGASDDVARISFSQNSLFTLAGTTTHTPTATDEVIMSNATLVNTTASADRVYSVVASSDRTAFRMYQYRQGVSVKHLGLERVAEAPGITTGTVVGWNSTIGYQATIGVAGHGAGATAPASGAAETHAVWYNGGIRATAGGVVSFGGNPSMSPWSIANTNINGGQPVFPVLISIPDLGNAGWLGARYDAFVSLGTSALGDVIDDVSANTRIIYAGESIMTPWDINQGLVTS